MSYQIQYNPELNKQYTTKRIQKRNLLPLIVLIGVLIVAYVAIQTNIISILVPGEEAVTAAAFSELVDNVESGVPVRESLLTFCREIIENSR